MLFSDYKFPEYKYMVRTGIPPDWQFKLNGFMHEAGMMFLCHKFP